MFFFKLIISGLVWWWCVQCATVRHRRHENKYSTANQLNNVINQPTIYESSNCLHNLCTNVTNYPAGYIQNVISKNKQFHQYFGSVIQPYNQPKLSAKSSHEYEEKNMCDTIQFKYFPEIAKNRLNKRVIIVNVENFRQAVSFETCVPKAQCFLFDQKPIGYDTFCKQQYNLIRLVSMTEDGSFALDSFPIPSSCVCSYKRILY